jgi:hypothetical protein
MDPGLRRGDGGEDARNEPPEPARKKSKRRAAKAPVQLTFACA